jgi:TonB family protein
MHRSSVSSLNEISLFHGDHTSSLQRWVVGSLLLHLCLLVWFWHSSLHFSSSSPASWLAIEVLSDSPKGRTQGRTSSLNSTPRQSSSRVNKRNEALTQTESQSINATADHSRLESSPVAQSLQSSSQVSPASGMLEGSDVWDLESGVRLPVRSGVTDPRALYLGRIYTKILRRVQYPETARRLGIQGRVKARLQLRWRTGEVISSQVLESPHPLLSQATEQLIRSLRQMDPAEPGLFPSEEIVVLVPFHYQLRE